MTSELKQNAFLSARKLCPTILPYRVGVLAQIEHFGSAGASGDKKTSSPDQGASRTISPADLPMKEAVRAQLQAIRVLKNERVSASPAAHPEMTGVSLAASSLPNRAAVLAQISALRGDKARANSELKTLKVRFQTSLA